MIYTKIKNLILIDGITLSESIVYSILVGLEGVEKDDKLVTLISLCSHAITRTTINLSLRVLKSKGYINNDLDIKLFPQETAKMKKIYTKAGRPKNANR